MARPETVVLRNAPVAPLPIGLHLEVSAPVLGDILVVDVIADAGDEGERVDTDGGFWLGNVIDVNDADGGSKLRLRSVRTRINAGG